MKDNHQTPARRLWYLFAAPVLLGAGLGFAGLPEDEAPAKHAAVISDVLPESRFLGGDPSDSRPNQRSADDPVRRLSEIEDMLRERPTTYALASKYRADCAASGQHDRAIKFFQDLLERHPDDARVQIELACSYVDKMPTCRGLTASLCKGSLARQSLARLDRVIARDRDSWVALYCRGMNHLHWPRVFRHFGAAADDFKRCLKLQQRDPGGGGHAYYVRAHVGLGDAHAKAKQYDRAIEAWREGLRRFPSSDELEKRLAIKGKRAILAFVDRQRGLDRPVDTGLAFLDP